MAQVGTLTARSLRLRCYVLEGLNAMATGYYFYYLFFLTRAEFGFGDLQNLLLSALNGLVYAAAAWIGGRVGQRRGYGYALRLGFGTMLGALAFGSVVSGIWMQIGIMVVWTLGMCFTWPNLEAAVTEATPAAELPDAIGIYNLVWAGAMAVSYFSGGFLFEKVGPVSIFIFPAVLHGAQLGLLAVSDHPLLRRRHPPGSDAAQPLDAEQAGPAASGAVSGERSQAKLFLRLAWVANPFAYMAINSVVPVIPGLAQRHDLSPMWAGFFCSAWFFSRLAAFAVLWLWTGWHYRFRWFIAAFTLLVASFMGILVLPGLAMVFVAQLGFGAACGLIYYSSLFYSMDVGDTKGDHGGIHETAIGLGVFAGPAVGAAGMAVWSGTPHAGAWAVGGLLVGGLVTTVISRARAGIRARA